ncbi:MAG: hypothetical protein IKH54_02320 [Bacilli bacterium]|nr:hypothetical protein [Bacilli bacterium]
MFDLRIQKEKLLLQIINLSENIKCIYDKMNIHNKDILETELINKIEEEKKLIDSLSKNERSSINLYLDIKNLLEETKFDKIKINIEDKEASRLFDKEINLTKSQKEELNDLVLERIQNYLLNKYNEKIKPSKFQLDNIEIINRSAINDYNSKFVDSLEELEYSSNSIAISNEAIKTRNSILFRYPKIEDKHINGNYDISEYQKLLDNGFNRDIVNDVYNTTMNQIIDTELRSLYIVRNDSLENRETALRFAINMQRLKAGLYFISNDNLEELLGQYESLNQDKTSVKEICSCMGNILNKNKVKQLKKVD